MKKYIKDMELKEVIDLLKKGLVIRQESSTDEDFYYFMKDGIICSYDDGCITIGTYIIKWTKDLYIEEPEPLKIKEGGLYKTRDGRKVFVAKILNNSFFCVLGYVTGSDFLYEWTSEGRICRTGESNKDLIEEWKD